MLFDVLLIAFAVLYAWALAAFLHTPVIRPVQRWLRRGWRRALVGCPWCFGFWVSLVFTIALHATQHRLDWVATPLTVLAAAALAALAGSFTQGIEDEDAA